MYILYEFNVSTLAGGQKHVAVLTVHTAEGLLLVRILVRNIVWQKTAKNQKVRVRRLFSV